MEFARSVAPGLDMRAEANHQGVGYFMEMGRRLQRYPRLLERMYFMTRSLVLWLAPLMKRLGLERVEPWIRRPEEAGLLARQRLSSKAKDRPPRVQRANFVGDRS